MADHIEDWFRSGAIDGFNLQPGVLVDGLPVIGDELVPILRKRGLYRSECKTHTLRDHSERLAPPLMSTEGSIPAAPLRTRGRSRGPNGCVRRAWKRLSARHAGRRSGMTMR